MSRIVTDSKFDQEVLQSQGLSLVDFWAEWCGPCKVLSPTIDAIAAENKTVNVFKLDVDSNPDSPARYGIRGIPTVLFFKNGKLVDQIVGAQPREVIQQTIAKHQGA